VSDVGGNVTAGPAWCRGCTVIGEHLCAECACVCVLCIFRGNPCAEVSRSRGCSSRRRGERRERSSLQRPGRSVRAAGCFRGILACRRRALQQSLLPTAGGALAPARDSALCRPACSGGWDLPTPPRSRHCSIRRILRCSSCSRRTTSSRSASS